MKLLSHFNKEQIKRIALYLAISFLFLLVFGDDSTPLTRYYYGSDSSLFMLFGKGLKYGYIPYIDLFDHKGPAMFFIEYIGQLIWEGKTGIFIVQVLNLAVTLLIVDKIINLANKNIKVFGRLLLTLPLLLHLAGALEGGNTNEEYTLAMSMFALYTTLIFFERTNKRYFNPIIGLIYGIMFGFIAFERLNNASFLCACALTVVVVLVANKKYLNVLQNAITCLLGTVIVSLAFILVYKNYGALNEMLYSCFLFAFEYAVEGQSFLGYFTLDHIAYILPIFISLYVSVKTYKKGTFYLHLSIITAISTFLATYVGMGFNHYFILAIPNYVLGIYLTVKYWSQIKDSVFNKKIVMIPLLLVMILGQAKNAAYFFASTMIHTVDYNATYKEKGYYKHFTQDSIAVVDRIPEDERNSIWGYMIGSKFYLRTNTFPCINVYDYLEVYELDDMGGVVNQLNNTLLNNPPKWFVLPTREVEVPDYIDNVLSKKYELDYKNDFFYLYHSIKK